MTTVGITSLGCAKNLVDSELILGILQKHGAQIVPDINEAEVIIVNTCGFIAEAQQESIETVLKAVSLKSGGHLKKIIVAGCLTQLYGVELRKQIPQVDAWIGVNDFPRIATILDGILHGAKAFEISSQPYIYDHNLPRFALTPVHYAYIKIAEGCDQLCSFCIIPNIKGKQRSRDENSILTEVKALFSRNVKELLLISQDSTEYGKDLGKPKALAGLLKRICALDGEFWIRILYTYPSHWTDELINVFASEEKICKYVDVPIQHINDAVLKSMRRGESKETIESLISKLREKIPGVFLRTSVIVGYPGETDEQFDELCSFLKHVQFERLGAFTFSPEKGSAATEMEGQVSDSAKNQRYDEIMRLQQKISFDNNSRLLGKRLRCIVDGKSDESSIARYVGRTYGDAPEVDGMVYLQGEDMKAGDFITAEITGFEEYDLIGKVIK
jgi:ribosomal protein S12 methylthiotransferase